MKGIMSDTHLLVLVLTMFTAATSTFTAQENALTTKTSLTYSNLEQSAGTKCNKSLVKDASSYQTHLLCLAKNHCDQTRLTVERPTTGVYCNITWDGVMCWPYTRAGTMAKQNCAAHVINFPTTEFATKQCMEDGTWYSDEKNISKTNFSACIVHNHRLQMDSRIKEHMPTIQLIYRTGYSISLGILLVAIVLMLIFKRLHCQRNIVHVNLFVSFVLRAMLCLLKDLQYTNMSATESHDHSSWECKLLFTLMHYALGANYMWIFVEGLYLHTLIITAVFTHNRIFKWYIVLGWVSPLLFVIPWVIVRIYLENTWCWTTHEGGYYWILKAPIIASIFVNFFFFINIIRVLFTKLMANNTRDPKRYRKLAKSTLVLIPLFGVHYVLFIIIPDDPATDLKLIKFYTETVFNSFQGVIVAFLFCFLNGEVRSEIMKKWHRHRLRRDSRLPDNTRTSRAYSSVSFFTRERGASITTEKFAMSELGPPNTDINATGNEDVGIVFEVGNHNHVTDGNHDSMRKNLSSVSEGSEDITPMLRHNGVS